MLAKLSHGRPRVQGTRWGMIKGRFTKFDVSLFFRQEMSSMRLRKLWVYGFGFALAASVACGGGGSSAPGSSAAPAAAPGGGGKEDEPAPPREITGAGSVYDSA